MAERTFPSLCLGLSVPKEGKEEKNRLFYDKIAV
jgi:hypothetical protein